MTVSLDSLRGLGWRAAWAGLLFVFGFGLMVEPTDGLLEGFANSLFGCACLVGAAVLVAPALARIVVDRAGEIYYPERTDAPPRPLYGIPAAKVARGHYEDAMQAYEKIALAFPEELTPYVEMIDLAIVRFKNPYRAAGIYKQGMAALKDPAAKEALTRMYEAIRSRLQSEPDWMRREQSRKITLP